LLFQGIAAGGGEAVSAGILPTSAVSFLTKKHGFCAGIVISASHNPYRDNGIKIFSREGLKISEEWEARLEKALAGPPVKTGRRKPRITPREDLAEDYRDFLQSQLRNPAGSKDLRVVVDCSNGASFAIAPLVFFSLGFKTIPIFNAPDGKNINHRCGSLHPESLARLVVDARADMGIAYDGDADRALWVDARGKILNGDHTLFVQSHFMNLQNLLKSGTVVATTMSNVGLEKALRDMGVGLVRTRVGDKYVLEKMLELGANLGGERSGHTIFLDDCPTGDGILTSLKMLQVMLSSGASLGELTVGLREFPQILRNVRVREKTDFKQFPEIIRTMEEIKAELAGAGRIDVRYSGTEPLARVMVEGEDQDRIETLAGRMTSVIKKYLGE
jgi:phosphoglucosamine mutase